MFQHLLQKIENITEKQMEIQLKILTYILNLEREKYKKGGKIKFADLIHVV